MASIVANLINLLESRFGDLGSAMIIRAWRRGGDMTDDVTLFTEVDQTSDPDFFIRFLDRGNALPSIVQSKPIILDGLRLSPGSRILDLGCGMGADVFDIAHRVGSAGAVTGVDVSEVMIAQARQRAEGLNLPVSFEVANAQALRFEDASFDACRTERMLMHVPDPELALSEMVRVTKPSGRISVFDFDWDTFVIDSPDKTTTRAVVTAFSDGIRNGWIGRALPRLFRENGMTDVHVVGHTVFIDFEFLGLLIGGPLTAAQAEGVLDPGDVSAWWKCLAEADERGNFLAGFTAFIVSGSTGA
jgi:ubiquinone/menaquinone biosynthesis C-methylase UbiE